MVDWSGGQINRTHLWFIPELLNTKISLSIQYKLFCLSTYQYQHQYPLFSRGLIVQLWFILANLLLMSLRAGGDHDLAPALCRVGEFQWNKYTAMMKQTKDNGVADCWSDLKARIIIHAVPVHRVLPLHHQILPIFRCHLLLIGPLLVVELVEPNCTQIHCRSGLGVVFQKTFRFRV